ncbi:MAG: methyl-accepting chemotaxis protein [Spirochaetales bacterium]|nr:methyl-accepting chemotaxis protein [Spirochaetales bacterium]
MARNVERKPLLGSLNGKIQVLFAAVFIVAVVGLQLVVFTMTYRGIEAQYMRELDQTTAMIEGTVRTYVDSSVRNYLIGRAESVRGMVDYQYRRYRSGELSETEAYAAASRLMLDPVVGKIGTTGYLAGVSSKGVLTIHPKSPGADASGYDFMKQATTMKNGYLEYRWKNAGETEERDKAGGMSYFEPWDIIVWASSYKAEFFDLIDLDRLEERLLQIKLGTRGYVFVMDKNGTLLIHPTRKGESVYDETDTDGRYYAREMLERKNGSIQYTMRNEDKHDKGMTRFTYFPELELIIAAKVYYDDIFALVRTTGIFGAIAALVTLVIGNVLIAMLIARITRPIGRMRAVADAVAMGRLKDRIAVTSVDEIGMMSGHFNALIDAMEAMVTRLKSSSGELFAAVQDLSVTSQEITTTSNQQAAAVKEIVSTMEDSDQLSRSIAVRINEVSSIANDTRRVVDEGDTRVRRILEKMREIRGSNDGTIHGIRTLGEKIDSIWEIVNIINGIADQTKIIAFNAELEAAAAGQAGKNFQIVAAEIRRLADSTVTSTTAIKNKITEIQHSSDHLIIASEEGTSRIQEGDAITEELRAMFEDIRGSSEISAKSAEKIALSINQQVTAFEQILLTLRQISEGIDNFVTTTRATVKSTASLKEMAEGMQAVVDSYEVD